MSLYSAIRFSGYKVFPVDETICLESLGKVNVIIGKNNSGKSSLIDVIGTLYNGNIAKTVNDPIRREVEVPFYSEYIKKLFDIHANAGYSEASYAKRYEGKFINIEFPDLRNVTSASVNNIQQISQNLSQFIRKDISDSAFLRLSAERDIVPESVMELGLSANGAGASNIIREYLNNSELQESLIEDTLLVELNKIMMPEAEYESIRIQEVVVNKEKVWEVFLQEKGRERVALSRCGSGLKTILLVLLNLYVVKKFKAYKNKKVTYAFEELENNLHPAMQRRLFEYLYDFAERNDTTFFITTHSHVAINTYYGREDAAIYHIIKKNGRASVKKIESYLDKTEILDDLDVKASDILQANGIIWVEGPSDRIYIRRWLEIFTENKFVEGKDYQFLYYGGRILSHYAAVEETNDFISIVKINRNAAIVIDSDKRKKSDVLNDTKKRVIKEFEELKMFCWVTEGKEIENYITKEAVSGKFGKDAQQCEKYELFPDYLEEKVDYHNFSNKKVQFAKEICPYINGENSKRRLDLKEKIESLYQEICKWNETA